MAQSNSLTLWRGDYQSTLSFVKQEQANPFGFKIRIEYGKNTIVYQISPDPNTKLEEDDILVIVKGKQS